jgi:hypothetical protein
MFAVPPFFASISLAVETSCGHAVVCALLTGVNAKMRATLIIPASAFFITM